MGFEIDQKIVIELTNNEKLRKAFDDYCKSKPD